MHAWPLTTDHWPLTIDHWPLTTDDWRLTSSVPQVPRINLICLFLTVSPCSLTSHDPVTCHISAPVVTYCFRTTGETGDLSPMHSGRFNWTQLNSTEVFSSVQFSSVSRCALNRRRPATIHDKTGGRRRFFTVGVNSRESANQCNVCHWTKTGDDWRRPSPVYDCQEPANVAARRRLNAQRKTQLNSTKRCSWVELSWVFRCALGFIT